MPDTCFVYIRFFSDTQIKVVLSWSAFLQNYRKDAFNSCYIFTLKTLKFGLTFVFLCIVATLSFWECGVINDVFYWEIWYNFGMPSNCRLPIILMDTSVTFIVMLLYNHIKDNNMSCKIKHRHNCKICNQFNFS